MAVISERFKHVAFQFVVVHFLDQCRVLESILLDNLSLLVTLNIWFSYGGWSRGDLFLINGRLSWLTQNILSLRLVWFENLDDLVLVERYTTLPLVLLILVWRFFERCRLVIFRQFSSVFVEINNGKFDIAHLTTGIVAILDIVVLDVEWVRLALMLLFLPILERLLLACASLLFLLNHLLAQILNSLILVIHVLFRLE